jgi:Domain of unknown function (DUF1707)
MAGWRAAALRFAFIVLVGRHQVAGPGDEIAAGAAGRSHLRASHADREQVIDVLKAAYVQGRLIKAELDLRVGQVLASLTYADLAALTAGIPAGPAGAQPLEPARESDKVPAPKTIARVVAAGTAASMVFTGAELMKSEVPRYWFGPRGHDRLPGSRADSRVCDVPVTGLREELQQASQRPSSPGSSAP